MQDGLVKTKQPLFCRGCFNRENHRVGIRSCPTRVRTPTENKLEIDNRRSDDAQSDARSDAASGLERLAELWPMLSELDRLALVDHAEHLVALRSGGEAVAGLDGGDASESRLSASGGSGQATARPVKGRGKRDAKSSSR